MSDIPKRSHLDPGTFTAAVEDLSDADMLRLRKKAVLRAFGTGWTGNDLFNEAVTRTLEATRKCPTDVSVSKYLDGAMRSIAEEARKHYGRETPAGSTTDEAGPIRRHLDSSGSPGNDPVNRIELDQMLKYLEDLFSQDPQALTVLRGDLEGRSAQEIKDSAAMTDTEYATARRRIRRTIEAKFGRG